MRGGRGLAQDPQVVGRLLGAQGGQLGVQPRRVEAGGMAEGAQLIEQPARALCQCHRLRVVAGRERNDAGLALGKGTLDVLLEAGWVKFRGRRRTPGRPVTFGTTRDFLDHFGMEDIRDLPGIEELKAAGMLSGRIPSGLSVPIPRNDDELGQEEDPITQLDLEELGLLTPGGGEEE